MASSVFVSFSSHDHELVHAQVVQVLEKQGLSVWFSRDSIHAADEWEKRIRHALNSSEWFVVALTANSVHSEWVRAEVDWAFENRRGRLVPVLLGDCDPQDCHLRLRQIQHIDLRNGNSTGEDALLRVFESGPGRTGQPTDQVRPHSSGKVERLIGSWKKSPGRWIAACAACLIVAVTLVTLSLNRGPTQAETDQKKDDSARHDTTKVQDRSSSQPTVIGKTPAAEVPAPSEVKQKQPVLVELGLKRPANPVVPGAENAFQVTYEYQRKGDTLHVGYRMPYLEDQRQGKTVRGRIKSEEEPFFSNEFPILSVKVLNVSSQSVMVTECIVEVAVSKIDKEPALIVIDRRANGIWFVNEGWGHVIDPVLTFAIHPLESKLDEKTAQRHTLKMEKFRMEDSAYLMEYVPKELKNAAAVAVTGELEFGEAKERKKLAFSTTMPISTKLPPGQVESIIGTALDSKGKPYDLRLSAGKVETLRVPVAHIIKPGEADHFELQLASDMSAHYELKPRLRLIDGTELPLQNVVLDEFVSARAVEKATKVDPQRLGLKLAHFGDHRGATSVAEELIKVGPYIPSSVKLYDAACIYALSAKAAQADAKLADQYADKAIALLRRARDGYGILDFYKLVKIDTDLDSLRQREDFKMLLAPPKEKSKVPGS
jgi:hypothetical protein